jgi:hypothetical protein
MMELTVKLRGKIHSVTFHEDTDGKQRNSYTLSLTSAALPIYRKLGEQHGHSGLLRKISSLLGFEPSIIQPVASRNNDYTIPAHKFIAYAGNRTPVLRSRSLTSIPTELSQFHQLTLLQLIWRTPNFITDLQSRTTKSANRDICAFRLL